MLLGPGGCGHTGPKGGAIKTAVQSGYFTTVRMLLDYRVKHGRRVPIAGTPAVAAKHGHYDILEALLNDGGYEIADLQPLLVHAIDHEHKAMFRLLLSHGVDPKVPETSVECVKVAKEKGLESMLDLLAQAGVDMDNVEEGI